jgi:hypothetical protein
MLPPEQPSDGAWLRESRVAVSPLPVEVGQASRGGSSGLPRLSPQSVSLGWEVSKFGLALRIGSRSRSSWTGSSESSRAVTERRSLD